MTKERCRNCDKYYIKLHSRHYFCSSECKVDFNYRNQEFEIRCDQCGRMFFRKTKKKNNEYSCCSVECVTEYKKEKYNETRKCEICGEDFDCKKISPKKYCSLKCQIQWQKENPRTGKNHPSYIHEFSDEYRTKTCEWCGIDFTVKPDEKEKRKFCSKECRQTWYAEVYSQTDEWRERKSISAANQMKNNKQTLSEPQIKINNLLSDMGIKYENESVFGNFAVDNFLIDYNLIIEVMGTFWHCDVRKYSTIEYENQKTRIKMDKIKNKIITKNYGVPILYLWEKDIENMELCNKLIFAFVSSNGNLLNYDSSNYLIINDELNIYDEEYLILQYMFWDIEDINKIIPPERKEKMSRKQLDKWITYKCFWCGKETEELISHYNKSKNHFCGYECANKYKKHR